MKKTILALALTSGLTSFATLNATTAKPPAPFPLKESYSYNPTYKYTKGQIVTYNGNTYVALNKIAAGVTPISNTNLWLPFTSQGPVGPDGSVGPVGPVGPAGTFDTNSLTNPSILTAFASALGSNANFLMNLGMDGVNVAIGTNAGAIQQGLGTVAIGSYAGFTNQQDAAVAIGYYAGEINQSAFTVAIGDHAGYTNQGVQSVAIGNGAGMLNQNGYSVAIGQDAGYTNQGGTAEAIGLNAGNINQGQNSVALGYNAGDLNQGHDAVAVGVIAGQNNQGNYAVAIGSGAGRDNQSNNSIVINATGSDVNTTAAGGLYVKPIRATNSAIGLLPLYYNTHTGEIMVVTPTP